MNLNAEIIQTQRNLNALREMFSPRNTAVVTLENRLQRLLTLKKRLASEMIEAMKDAPEEVQELFKLRYIDGEQWAEVAKRLNYSESMIYKWHRQYKGTLPLGFLERELPERKFFNTY